MSDFAPVSCLRELTGFDEEWIARDGAFRSAPAACHHLLARCMDSGTDEDREPLDIVRALSLGERDRLLLVLRERSLGPRICGEVQCPKCNNVIQVEFATQDLMHTRMEPNAASEVRLPGGGLAVLRQLTARDHEEFALERGLDSTGQLKMALKRVLVSVDGRPAKEAWSRLTDADIAALADGLTVTRYQETRLRMQCNQCQQALDAPFDVCGFFLPN